MEGIAMQRFNSITVILFFLLVPMNLPAQHHHDWQLSASKKDPALAAVLSLQPLPIDLGSFYAGNWERGIIYTAAQIALFVPATVLMAENSNWWGHHRYDPYYYADANRKTWSAAERERFYFFVGGYVLVKIISAFDAAHSVERRNIMFSLKYDDVNRSTQLSLSFAL